MSIFQQVMLLIPLRVNSFKICFSRRCVKHPVNWNDLYNLTKGYNELFYTFRCETPFPTVGSKGCDLLQDFMISWWSRWHPAGFPSQCIPLCFHIFLAFPTEVGFNIPYNAMNNAYPAQVIRQELGSRGCLRPEFYPQNGCNKWWWVVVRRNWEAHFPITGVVSSSLGKNIVSPHDSEIIRWTQFTLTNIAMGLRNQLKNRK